MKGLDTNVLVHAHRADSPWHGPASQAVRELAEGRAAWAIPWPCLHEVLAILTHARIWNPPTPLKAAWAQIEAWRESPTLVLLRETEGYADVLRHALLGARVAGARVHDARVAALCLHHGVRELWTADRDFQRFPELVTRNPLVA